MGNQKKSEKPGPRSVYLGELYTEIQAEAARLDRSASWLIREAWRIAVAEIRDLPSVQKDA